MIRFTYEYLGVELFCVENSKTIRFYEWRNEFWKRLKDVKYPYLISSFGRVKSLPRFVNNGSLTYIQPSKMMSQFVTYGYHRVALRVKNEDMSIGKQDKFLVHKLMSEVFFKIDLSLDLIVNHIDLIKSNNHVSNLEIVTRSENVTHYYLSNSSNKKSKYMGVIWISKKNRWQVKTIIDGKNKFKNFKDEELAYKYYLDYANQNKSSNKYLQQLL